MSIRLNKKYGLNPSIVKCWLCGKDKAIALFGANHSKKAPHECYDGELCDDCKKRFETERLILEINENTKKQTGRFMWVPKEAIRNEEALKHNILLMSNLSFAETFEGTLEDAEEVIAEEVK